MQPLGKLLRKTTGNQLLNQVKSALVCEHVQKLIESSFGRQSMGDIKSLTCVGGVVTIKTKSPALKQNLKYKINEYKSSLFHKFGVEQIKDLKLQ